MNTFMKRTLTVLLAALMLCGACAMAEVTNKDIENWIKSHNYDAIQAFPEDLSQAQMQEGDWGYQFIAIPVNESKKIELVVTIAEGSGFDYKDLKVIVHPDIKDNWKNPITNLTPPDSFFTDLRYDEDNRKLIIEVSGVGRNYILLGRESQYKQDENRFSGPCYHWEVNAYNVEDPAVATGSVGGVDSDALDDLKGNVINAASYANRIAYGTEQEKMIFSRDFVEGGYLTDETLDNLVVAAKDGMKIETEVSIKESTPSTAASNAISAELNGGEAVAAFLDLSIGLSADGDDLGTLDKLLEPTTFTVDLPAEAQQPGLDVYLVNYHGGEATRIPATVSADGKTASFPASEFSPYAIVYGDPTANNDLPKTGDDSNLMLWTAMMMTAIAGAMLLMRRKQTN